MLTIMLIACQDKPGDEPQELETMEVQAFTYGDALALDGMSGAEVAVDDRSGHRIWGETNNSGTATIEVDPDDGPFDVTVHSTHALPHAYTRMGLMPEDGAAVFAFDHLDAHAAMVDVWGRAASRHEGTRLGVAAHMMDLTPEGRYPVSFGADRPYIDRVFDGSALDDWYRVSVRQHEPFTLLAYEYTHQNGEKYGEFDQHFRGWYRFAQDPRLVAGRVDLDLGKSVRSEVALGDIYTTPTFTGPLAEMHAQVTSRSSGYNAPCGFPIHVERMPHGWTWAIEWVSPIEDEDVSTMVWATGRGATTMAVRHGPPSDFPAVEMLPAPRLVGSNMALLDTMEFEQVPADARAIIDVIPTRLTETVLWRIEGPKGAHSLSLPDLIDASLLPEIDLSVIPRLEQRAGYGSEDDYDMSEGPAIEL